VRPSLGALLPRPNRSELLNYFVLEFVQGFRAGHTGRWLAQDPLGFDGGDSNLYRYVNNQPTEARDPSGMDPGFIQGISELNLMKPGNQKIEQGPNTTLEAKKFFGPSPGFDGAFAWQVDWQLKPKSSKAGFIVQYITWTWKVTDKAGNDVPDPTGLKSPLHYWEAWPVAANSTAPLPTFDNWSDGVHKNTKGKITITATAWFFEGYELPEAAGFKKNNKETTANMLLSTKADPKLPTPSSNGVGRNLTITWDSCDGKTKSVLSQD
jgi:hypothetical protein